MRHTLACVSLALLLGACSVEAPPPSPAKGAPAPNTTPAGPAGGQFFCRTDRGERRDLLLRTLALRVTTKPGTVRSHLTMEVAGPADGRVEAVMRLAVPRGAAVSGAILWVNGRPMNGAFVQRDRARQIYRSIVERRRDPALVTWDGPGWLAVSIFPLESGEPRRFELEWIEPAATEAGVLQYRVPTIANAGRVIGRPSLEVDGHAVAIADREVVALTPASVPLVVAGRTPGDPFHHLLARASASDGAAHVVVVAETSAAMTAVDRVRQRAAIKTVLGALPATSKVTLLAADWDVSVIADQVDPAAARQALDKLDSIVSAGALHLERTLTDAVLRARKGAGTTVLSAVLFVGRGVDGFNGDAIHGPLTQLRDVGVRLSVVATNDVPPALADAAALTGGEALGAATLGDELGALVDALKARPAPPSLAARGLDWRALETVTGQTVWVGRALELAPPQTDAEPAITAVDPAELLPLWDRAQLAWSEHSGHAVADRNRTTALTPLRALLVLESEQDYARFGLAAPESPPRPTGHDRDIAADSAVGADAMDVLGGVIGNQMGQAYGTGGLGLLSDRSGGGSAAEAPPGLGNMGTIGAGKGKGSGYGASDRGDGRARLPDVIPGKVSVLRGEMNEEILRRIVRRHLNELRYCYEQGLPAKPDLGGRITVQLTIAPSGKVSAAVVESTTLGNARVESCMFQAVRRWEFPQTHGGDRAVVAFPFVLTPGGRLPSVAPNHPNRTVEPELSTWEPLVALTGKYALARRVERVAALLGLDHTSDPESLAWMIDRRGTSGRELLLAARLLVAAHRNHDAIRVLSEWASARPDAAVKELRRMGADADAAEVLTLARRR